MFVQHAEPKTGAFSGGVSFLDHKDGHQKPCSSSISIARTRSDIQTGSNRSSYPQREKLQDSTSPSSSSNQVSASGPFLQSCGLRLRSCYKLLVLESFKLMIVGLTLLGGVQVSSSYGGPVPGMWKVRLEKQVFMPQYDISLPAVAKQAYSHPLSYSFAKPSAVTLYHHILSASEKDLSPHVQLDPSGS